MGGVSSIYGKPIDIINYYGDYVGIAASRMINPSPSHHHKWMPCLPSQIWYPLVMSK